MSATSWFVWSLWFLVVTQVGCRAIDTLLHRLFRHRYTLEWVYWFRILFIINLTLVAVSGFIALFRAILAIVGIKVF